MYNLDAFTDAQASDAAGKIIPPWLVNLEEEKDLCEWTVKSWDSIAEGMSFLWASGRDNLMRYMGYYSGGSNSGAGIATYAGKEVRAPLQPRVGINMIRLLVEQRVTKTNKITPITQVINAQDDSRDKAAARTGQKVLESYKYRYNYKALRTKQLRRTFLDGSGYAYTNWNKKFGGVKSGSKAKKVRIPDAKGKTVTLDNHDMMGDVDVRLLRMSDVGFLLGHDLGGTYAYGVILPVNRPVMEVRADYPERAEEIEASKCHRFNYATLEDEELVDHVTEYHVYIRSTPYMPKGMHWICTDKVELEPIQDNPIPWTPAMEVSELGNLPVSRIGDVDIEGFFHGASALMDINMLQNQYDKLTSFIMKSIWHFAHPKFVVPRGGVNIEQLAAGGGLVVQSSGPFQPYVATYQVISQDVIKMWERLPELAGKLYGIYDHSMGQAPTGTRSASQLMIYDEQEEETRETIKQKLEACAIEMDSKVLAIVSANFKEGEDRVMQSLGDNRMWHPEKIDVKDLKLDTVVRLKVSSMLPENKYARVRTLVELGGMYPGMFSPEQVADALEIGQHEKFIDYARLSIQVAEAENEAFLKGDEVVEPKMYEDLMNHWKIHAKMFQSFSFKKLSEKEQEAAIDHMRATEYLMFQQADQNPAFKQDLLTIKLFPLFFVQQDIGISAPAAPMGPDVSQMGNGQMPQLAAIAGEQPQQ